MKQATLFEKLSKYRVRCLACAHYCRIADGKTGICGVRKNIDGKLYLLVYAKAAAVNIDPIEKKPLYHYKPGTDILSFGTAGCNFKCSFCQNWEISQATKGKQARVFGQELPPEQIVNLALEHGCPSIAYTYNEPGIFFEYALDTMKLAKKAGLANVYVSNGYLSSEARSKISKYLDAANIDLKSFDDGFYKNICGARLEPVLETIRDFQQKRIHLELTTLTIPGHNDDDENLSAIANFIADLDNSIPWHISRFFPSYEMMRVTATSDEKMQKAEKIGREAGLINIYMGNL